MNYKEALDFINGVEGLGSKLGLNTIRKLMSLLGNPQRDVKCIHIAGTNGKGSTTAYISNMLIEAGYKVGTFTSPYLERFNERIQINGEDIPDEVFARTTEKVKEKTEEMLEEDFPHPTVFELITAIMFLYFKEENVDFAVLEVGLGGRIDSTNVIDDSLISVITTINYDHMEILGDTLYKIGREKAGIIKKNGIVISYPQEEEALKALKECAKEKNAEFAICPMGKVNIKELSDKGSIYDFEYKGHIFKDININMIGDYQIYNSALALSTIVELRENHTINITDEEIMSGLKRAIWKGRLEVLRRDPIFLIDGSHNIQGIKSLAKAIELFKYDRLILGIGILKDKDVDHMIEVITPLADTIIVTEPDSFRKMEANELAKKIKEYNRNVLVEKDIKEAIDKSLSLANKNDLIVFCGSIYLIGNVRKIFLNN